MRSTLMRRFGFGALVASALVLGPTMGSVVAPSGVAGAATPLPIHVMPVRWRPHRGDSPGRWARRPVKLHGAGIDEHGGPVMTGPVGLHVIWYGDWASAPQRRAVVGDLLSAIGGSSYFAINTTYTSVGGRPVTNQLTVAEQLDDAGSVGTKALSDDAIRKVVAGAVTSGRLASDPSGIYVVLTAANVTKTGFGTQYCGWHTHASLRGADLKFAFIGDPSSGAMRGCAGQPAGPNADVAADAMASVIAHELAETVTDPDLNAWYDSTGAENADKCAWRFGTTHAVTGGGTANVRLGAREYLLQANWRNSAGGACVTSV
jgi:hypothetical protein